jgi:hypothetical protein
MSTDNAIVHHGVLDAGTQFLAEPFTSADLARKVREVLDGGTTSLADGPDRVVRDQPAAKEQQPLDRNGVSDETMPVEKRPVSRPAIE